nr:unnamed protein product [Spirometra erinaceieuropaei]
MVAAAAAAAAATTTGLSCIRIRTTTYYLPTNEMIGRFHRQLRTSTGTADDPENWIYYLPWALLDIRSAPKSDTY